MVCESSKVMDNAQDQIADRPSTWLRAPAPARFVRKQNRVESSSVSQENMDLACESNTSATAEIDDDIWTFANRRNSTLRAHTTSTQSKYYLAHRQHVAGELTEAETVQTAPDSSCDALWDGLLRALSE